MFMRICVEMLKIPSFPGYSKNKNCKINISGIVKAPDCAYNVSP